MSFLEAWANVFQYYDQTGMLIECSLCTMSRSNQLLNLGFMFPFKTVNIPVSETLWSLRDHISKPKLNGDCFLFLIEWQASLFSRTVAWLCRLKLINGLFESSFVLLSNAVFTQPAHCVKWALIFSVQPMTGFCFVAVLKQRRESDAALFSELHRKLQTQVGHINQSYNFWNSVLM